MSYKIPDGWTYEVDGFGKGYDTISTPSPERYTVTIDWDRRCGRGGMSTFGEVITRRGYTGRGWRQRLVDDAVAWLRKLRGGIYGDT